MEQGTGLNRPRQIIDSLNNPRTRRVTFQKFDSGELIDARTREAFRKRKERIQLELEKDAKKVGKS